MNKQVTDAKPSLIKESDIVYIAGQMTGILDFNVTAFNEAEHLIKTAYGCTVLNPARHPQVGKLSREYYMEHAEVDVRNSDVVVFIKGEYVKDGQAVKHAWENSDGAKQEWEWSHDLCKRCLEIDEIVRELERVGGKS